MGPNTKPDEISSANINNASNFKLLERIIIKSESKLTAQIAIIARCIEVMSTVVALNEGG